MTQSLVATLDGLPAWMHYLIGIGLFVVAMLLCLILELSIALGKACSKHDGGVSWIGMIGATVCYVLLLLVAAVGWIYCYGASHAPNIHFIVYNGAPDPIFYGGAVLATLLCLWYGYKCVRPAAARELESKWDA